MLARERALGLSTVQNPLGLVYPVVFADGVHFPQEARDVGHTLPAVSENSGIPGILGPNAQSGDRNSVAPLVGAALVPGLAGPHTADRRSATGATTKALAWPEAR